MTDRNLWGEDSESMYVGTVARCNSHVKDAKVAFDYCLDVLSFEFGYVPIQRKNKEFRQNPQCGGECGIERLHFRYLMHCSVFKGCADCTGCIPFDMNNVKQIPLTDRLHIT